MAGLMSYDGWERLPEDGMMIMSPVGGILK